MYNIRGGAGGTSSTFADDFPWTGTAVGFVSSSGEMVPVVLTPSGELPISGSFSSTPPTSSTSSAPAPQTVGTSAITILESNGSRKACSVQNTGTTVIKIALGQTPTGTAYHIALPAGGSANDGSSNRWDGTISGVLWQGAVFAISSVSGGVVVVTELT